eukprot:GHVQ01009018.1.p1 GENE.GHVQ01009018.1~~GHVQ01009018.1.p1  ORF type:complete len:1639 (+),score=226.92 GHVQ01009018.1:122-5038(+)
MNPLKHHCLSGVCERLGDCVESVGLSSCLSSCYECRMATISAQSSILPSPPPESETSGNDEPCIHRLKSSISIMLGNNQLELSNIPSSTPRETHNSHHVASSPRLSLLERQGTANNSQLQHTGSSSTLDPHRAAVYAKARRTSQDKNLLQVSLSPLQNEMREQGELLKEKTGAGVDKRTEDTTCGAAPLSGTVAGNTDTPTSTGRTVGGGCMSGGPAYRFGCKTVTDMNAEEQEPVARRHQHSADLFALSAPAQSERQLWRPVLPDSLDSPSVELIEFSEPPKGMGLKHRDQLKAVLPNITDLPYVEVRPTQDTDRGATACGAVGGADTDTPDNNIVNRGPPLTSMSSIGLGGGTVGAVSFEKGGGALRVGLVLSGGPAPGGHNVIAGLYDYIKGRHNESQLFGMLGGLDGMFLNKYKVVSDDIMDRFRNMGGFDMLWSGRGKVNGIEDMETAKMICQSLELHGLVMVGGDGSNSNAALLAEYFAKELPTCAVVGVPKTIDGDLKNPLIEVSFGFDTAAKTYSELIGNLCTDVTSAQCVYHFIRVMGRSASHLAMECALQTRPNLVFIGEEVEREETTLRQIVDTIIDLILKRRELGKSYGVIILPEGLIEFIPEVKTLIAEINRILSEGNTFAESALSVGSREVWEFFPDVIREQLLMDREATGYIQVAKIATERLLVLMVEIEMSRRNIDQHKLTFMPHYFGYEGRCAMPSNFDANYCYSLGYNAGVLIDHRRNGYMSVVRYLDQYPSFWTPCGVPFTQIMEVKTTADGSAFPAVTRQLVDLDGPIFKALTQVRDIWKTEDLYRSPGPIQFEGPVADLANNTVQVPSKAQLLSGNSELPLLRVSGRGLVSKMRGCFGPLQNERLAYRPPVPSICLDLKAHGLPANQHIPQDPYARRQILVHYPNMAHNNHFYLHEVVHDKYTPPINSGLRVGIVFLSRQSPGVSNVLWGLYERLELVSGTCVGFFGLDGLLKKKCINGLTAADLELHLNQGGVDLLGRSTQHSLVHEAARDRALSSCSDLGLDGLVLVGSAFAMSEAALLCEHFLAKNCLTSVVGIPATGSNNMSNELIEACIGFDSSTKVYASLIGNVLTDAASMPKYWHFIRLMGRQPSHEVLECALQTHPNVVIIAEEYGAADKTLMHVVMDIADVVCQRAEKGKNFGTVLIPDALLIHLPNMKILLMELGTALKEADQLGKLKEAQADICHVEDRPHSEWVKRITPWSAALLSTFPKFIRKEMLQVDTIGELRFTTIETEELLAQMVKEELKNRADYGRYVGKFQAVTHFFGYQGRSSLPSQFDSKLAFAHGYLSSILIESGLTGYCTTIRGLCGNVEDWKLGGVPFVSLLRIVPNVTENHHGWSGDTKSDVPVIPSAEVDLQGKAFRWMKTAMEQWSSQDRFCNPGPMQFHGGPAMYYNRTLHEEQAEYFEMLRKVECYTYMLQDTCRFGISEHFLRSAFVNLNGLLTLALGPDDLSSRLPPLVDIEEYLANARNRSGQRPAIVGGQIPSGGNSGFHTPSIGSALGGFGGGVKKSLSMLRRGQSLSCGFEGLGAMPGLGFSRKVEEGGEMPGGGAQRLSAKYLSSQLMEGGGGGYGRLLSADPTLAGNAWKRLDAPRLPGLEEGPYAASNIGRMMEQTRKI